MLVAGCLPLFSGRCLENHHLQLPCKTPRAERVTLERCEENLQLLWSFANPLKTWIRMVRMVLIWNRLKSWAPESNAPNPLNSSDFAAAVLRRHVPGTPETRHLARPVNGGNGWEWLHVLYDSFALISCDVHWFSHDFHMIFIDFIGQPVNRFRQQDLVANNSAKGQVGISRTHFGARSNEMNQGTNSRLNQENIGKPKFKIHLCNML